MAKEKKTTVYKYEELVAQDSTAINAAFAGLHVSDDDDFSDFVLHGQNFRSDFFAIMLILDGQVDVSLNLQPYTLVKNHLAVAPPNSIKQLIQASSDATGMFVSFTLKFLTEAGLPKHDVDLLNYFTSAGKPLWLLDDADAVVVQRLIRDVLFRCQSARTRVFGKEQLYHTFFVFMFEMAALSQKYAPLVISQVSRKEDLVIRFAELVTKNFHQHRTLQYYADRLHVTPKYLTETVKEISGKNAGEIIDDFVILECKLMLDNPEYSVSQVASKMNFSDQSFFGKFFKRHTGVSPGRYRADALR